MESGAIAEQASGIAPSLTPPGQTAPQHSKEGCPTLANTYKGPAPYNITSAPRQRNMAQMKEQIKTPGKELSDEDNLSDAEFKTLVIRMLTEMMEYSCKIKEELKAMKSEIKKKYTGNQQ